MTASPAAKSSKQLRSPEPMPTPDRSLPKTDLRMYPKSCLRGHADRPKSVDLNPQKPRTELGSSCRLLPAVLFRDPRTESGHPGTNRAGWEDLCHRSNCTSSTEVSQVHRYSSPERERCRCPRSWSHLVPRDRSWSH